MAEVEKNKGGRPPIYTDEEIEKINLKMEDYLRDAILSDALPSITEFALRFGYRRQMIYEHDGLSDNKEKILMARELAIEKLGFSGKSNAAMAIFCLKNLGWTDRREIDLKGNVKHNYENKSDEELDEELAALEQDEED